MAIERPLAAENMLARDGMSVVTDAGTVRGLDAGGVHEFLGVPYAAPPIGALRWRPPEMVAPWQGERQVTGIAPQCPQPARAQDSVYHAYSGTLPSSEDCLYLNLWTPTLERSARLPVMVWFHGGGFRQGSGGSAILLGSTLPSRDIVLITFNYRLGALAFMAHPALTAESEHGSSGNYGLLDQVALLRWVKANVARFGGDPSNVTLFGQSAGAASIANLMVMPQARGLFHKAIFESSGLMDRLSLAEGERLGLELQNAAAQRDIAGLRALPADRIVQIASQGAVSMAPIIDGWAIPTDPKVAFAEGRQARVPVIVGWNRDEGSTFGFTPDPAQLRRTLTQRVPGAIAEAEAFYPSRSVEETKTSSIAFRGDKIASNTWRVAKAQEALPGTPVFLYNFARPQPFRTDQSFRELSPASALGAFHGAEYPFIFGTFDRLERDWAETDRRTSRMMQDYWINFARTGNPNGAGLPVWPRSIDGALIFADEIKAGPLPRRPQLELLLSQEGEPDLPAPYRADAGGLGTATPPAEEPGSRD